MNTVLYVDTVVLAGLNFMANEYYESGIVLDYWVNKRKVRPNANKRSNYWRKGTRMRYKTEKRNVKIRR